MAACAEANKMWKSVLCAVAACALTVSATNCNTHNGTSNRCPKNEHFKICPSPCPSESCNVNRAVIKCQRPPKPGDPNCLPDGCQCDPGFCRKNDMCIDYEHANKCKGSHEYWVQCPTCGPKACKDLDKIYHCPRLPANNNGKNCKGVCECMPGYYRNLIGDCISRNNCLKCKGKNEFFSCGGACDNVCKLLPYQNQTDCPIINVKCNDMCYCKKGFARNRNNICVPFSQCEPPCAPEEDYRPDAPQCPSDSCSDSTKRQAACGEDPHVSSCNDGCVCKPGLFRNDDNKCVPYEQCPKTGPCSDGEILSDCPPLEPCDGEYCPASRDDPQTCPTPEQCGRPQCVCAFNHHRDRVTGECIPTRDCPPFDCDGPNEEYVPCSSPCPGEQCAHYLNNAKCPRFHLPVVPCVPQCRCKSGHYRDCAGVCIPQDDCVSCTPSKPIDPEGSTNPEEDLKALFEANDIFTPTFFYEVTEENPGENIITSPFSVLFPLALLCLYSKGESRTQLENALNLHSDDQIRAAIRAIINYIEAQKEVELTVAFKTFINENYPLSQSFIDDATYFDSETQNVNFNKYIEAAKIINDWIADKTHDRIKDILSPDALNGATRLVLANAIYFLGNWTRQFNEKLTVERDFYVDLTTVVKKDMMTQTGNFNYGESKELDAQLLELLYKGNNVSMWIILPTKIDGIREVISKLRDKTLLAKAVSEMTSQKVKMNIPKFEFETKIDLKVILPKMGITKIFTGDSGLTGILENKESLSVTDALQKSFVKNNERGTEAAAANVVVISKTSAVMNPGDPRIFNWNHPAVFVIRIGNATIFIGTLVQ